MPVCITIEGGNEYGCWCVSDEEGRGRGESERRRKEGVMGWE